MHTIHEQIKDGIYSSDVKITKEEWLEILKDESVPVNYKEAVICYYYAPGHRGSCAEVGSRLGKNAYSLVATIMNFGKSVQRILGRFEVVGIDGKPTFWPIPMKEGRDLPKKETGSFEWILRPELVDAIREYLYWYLIERYKELRRTMPIRCTIDGKNYDELYKWELITKCQGKGLVEIVDIVKATNLVDAPRINGVIKDVIAKKYDDLLMVLQHLVNETKPLNARLAEFKSNMGAIIDQRFASKADDERTAATILTCYNPDKYTFYKYEGMYDNLCRYLGEEKKPTGSCYEHYLDLIRPLAEMAAKDLELQDLVSPMLDGQRKSDLLLAQDMVWMLVSWMPKRLGYLQPLVWPIHYWCVGYNYDGYDSQLPRFIENSIWEGRFDEKNDASLLKLVRRIRPKDVLVLKSSFTKGTGHKDPCLRVSALAEVIEKEEFDDNGFKGVRCKVNYFNSDKTDFDGAKYGKYRKTIDECTDLDIINYVLNKYKEMTIVSPYNTFVNLLKSNHNLILTGAPGTGKTYLAKQIAALMMFGQEYDKLSDAELKEIGFVQFHPSYDYTDFVEGLRPKEENGNVGFERRDGVFKAFCKKALSLFGDIQIQDAINQFKSDVKKTGSVTITSTKTSTPFNVSLNARNTICVVLSSNDTWSATDNNLIQYMKTGEYDKRHDTYLHSIGDYILETYLLASIAHNEEEGGEKTFVFIIDEINRGEISKIFGELFYSIDPGYRGEKGRVDTQYQNMAEEGDVFEKGFYVPENVYIIGTMNDIDRSVESMDFAMRRRFAWKEVTAEDSMQMLDGQADEEKLKNRMRNLNAAILEINGLGKAYQIGAAYFLKYEQYHDFELLWEYHLDGLLREYLRGNRNVDDEMKKLKKAYDNESAQNEGTDNDNGQ